jgi:hypothetical protein
VWQAHRDICGWAPACGGLGDDPKAIVEVGSSTAHSAAECRGLRFASLRANAADNRFGLTSRRGQDLDRLPPGSRPVIVGLFFGQAQDLLYPGAETSEGRSGRLLHPASVRQLRPPGLLLHPPRTPYRRLGR